MKINDYKEKNDTFETILPKGDMGSRHDTKQIVVRTNCYSYSRLENKLNEGYKVKFANKLNDDIIEYILEK